jgi:hypothetical protein
VAAFFLTNYLALGRFVPAYSEVGGPWYEYPGSYWLSQAGKEKHGIDWAWQKESKADYAFHLLLGHHGLFSLSPIYLLSVAGMIAVLLGRRRKTDPTAGAPPASSLPFLLFPFTLCLTLVVFGFYLFKTGNYGGWTSGLRWLMWLTPLWLLTMLPVADWLAARRWRRGIGLLLLAISVFSASYPAWNPWRHPWLYNFMENQGWIKY